MATEIERKFLVRPGAWRPESEGTTYRQGYLAVQEHTAVRIRSGGGKAVLTVKGGASLLERSEFEYEIPAADARAMLAGLCAGGIIEKTRYREPFAGMTWEVDVFHGANSGLMLAEIELEAAGQPFQMPPWAGQEVTEDVRYTNAYLAAHPWGAW